MKKRTQQEFSKQGLVKFPNSEHQIQILCLYKQKDYRSIRKMVPEIVDKNDHFEG